MTIKILVDTPNASESPEATIERSLIAEYLLQKGYREIDLRKLPKRMVKQIKKEANFYAALKLAEIEAKSVLREHIHLLH